MSLQITFKNFTFWHISLSKTSPLSVRRQTTRILLDPLSASEVLNIQLLAW